MADHFPARRERESTRERELARERMLELVREFRETDRRDREARRRTQSYNSIIQYSQADAEITRRILRERELSPLSPGGVTVDIDFTPVYRNIYRDKIWITSDGDIVPIPEMKTSHLKNCIRLCESKPDWWRTELFLKTLKEELKQRELKPEVEKPKRKRKIRTTNEDGAVGI